MKVPELLSSKTRSSISSQPFCRCSKNSLTTHTTLPKRIGLILIQLWPVSLLNRPFSVLHSLTMLASRRLLILQRPRSGNCLKRIKSTVADAVPSEAASQESASRPTNKQLWRVFNRAAIPMIGFGFTDQTVMLQAGNAIDCTLGVTFGLSTLVSMLLTKNSVGTVFLFMDSNTSF